MAKPSITFRSVKGTPLTTSELDTNFTNLRDATVTLTADTGGTAVTSDLNGNITLVAGSNVTIAGDNTSKTITISSTGGGGGGSGTVNSGEAGRIAFYPSTGTTVDDTEILAISSGDLLMGGDINMNGFVIRSGGSSNILVDDDIDFPNNAGPVGSGTLRLRNLATFDTKIDLTSTNVDITGRVDLSSLIKIGSLTTIERNALTAANGMLLYNSTTNTFQIYENGSWKDVSSGGGVTNPLSADLDLGSYIIKDTSSALGLHSPNGVQIRNPSALSTATVTITPGTDDVGTVARIESGRDRDLIINTLNTSGIVAGYLEFESEGKYIAVDGKDSDFYFLIGSTDATGVSRHYPMTTTQRNALTTVADGMLLANSTTNTFQARLNSNWVDLNSPMVILRLWGGVQTVSGTTRSPYYIDESLDTNGICTLSTSGSPLNIPRFALPAGTYIMDVQTFKFINGGGTNLSESLQFYSISGDSSITDIMFMRILGTENYGFSFQDQKSHMVLTQTTTFEFRYTNSGTAAIYPDWIRFIKIA